MKRTRIRPVNPDRRKKMFARNFGPKAAWVRDQGCVVCPYPSRAEAAHSRARGMGGCGGSAADLIPLCRSHHAFLDDQCGSSAVFQEATGVDLVAEAARLEDEWQQRAAA